MKSEKVTRVQPMAGDGDARLLAVFRKLRPQLEAFARVRHGCGADDARDAVSAAFESLWCGNRHSTRVRIEVALYDSVRRHAMRAHRDRARCSVVLDPESLESAHAGPEAEAIASDVANAVERAITRLPHAQRDCCRAVLLDGLSLTEAAGAIGRPAKTIANRIAEGRANLRRALGPHIDDIHESVRAVRRAR